MSHKRSLALKALLVPFSVFAWAMAFFWMALTVLISLILLPFMPFQRLHMLVARPMMSLCIYTTLSPVRVHYHPEFDKKRIGIFMGNHVASLDAHMMTLAIPGPFCGIVGAHHLKIPIYGSIIKFSRSIPVAAGLARANYMVEPVRERVADGIHIAAYPEGGRTRDGKIAPFKRGMFFLARDSDTPVYPIATRGMYEMLPRGSFLVKPTRLEIYVGKPMDFIGISDEDMPAAVERFRQVIIDFADHRKVEAGMEPLS
jgi:1-acyl-sn-glycerol-3-phosphate acyltransferase